MATAKKFSPSKVIRAHKEEDIFVLGLDELHDPILIRETFWKGNRSIAIRAYYQEQRSQKYLPTKRGINVRLAYLEELIDALEQLRTHIIKNSSDQGKSALGEPEYRG